MDTLPEQMRDAFGIDRYDTARSFLDGEMYSLLVPFAVSLFAIRHSRPRPRSARGALVARRRARSPARARADDRRLVSRDAGRDRDRRDAGRHRAALAAAIAGVDLPVGAVASGTLAVWLLASGFAAVALALSAATHRSGIVLGGASAVLVAMYVIDLAGTLVDSLEPIRFVSPFDHYGTPVASAISLSSAPA